MEKWSRVLTVVIVLGGAVLIGVATVADWIGLLGSPGIALKQALLAVGGGSTMLIGLALIVRGMPRRSHPLLDRYARGLALLTLVAILSCALIVGALGLVRLHGLQRLEPATADGALPLLKQLISIEYPQIRDPQLDDWEKVKLLRSWTYTHVNWGSQCAQMNQEQYRTFFGADAATLFSMFLKDEGAVMCQGAAFALMKLYEAYGYEAYYFGVELPGVMSHAMTLVRIDYDGKSILSVQDAWWDICYVHSDGAPYDYFDLLAAVSIGDDELVRIEQGACNPRYYLFCTDEEFGGQAHESSPAGSPVPALSEGRMKVKLGWTVDDSWTLRGTAISDYLQRDGYPPRWTYVFLYPLYLRDGHGDVRALMD